MVGFRADLAAVCYCLAPHIPSLTDRSEGATGTSLPRGGGVGGVGGGGVGGEGRGRPPLATQCLSTDAFWWWEWCCRSLGPGKETHRGQRETACREPRCSDDATKNLQM